MIKGTRVLAGLLATLLAVSAPLAVQAETEQLVSDKIAASTQDVSGNMTGMVSAGDQSGESVGGSEDQKNETADAGDPAGEETGDRPEDISANDKRTQSEEAGTTDQEEKELFPGLPEQYQLSAQEMSEKRQLGETLKALEELEEGDDYVPGQVLFLCDSEEIAGLYAEAYGAELISFSQGVAVLALPGQVKVYQAVQAASDTRIKLPAVEPNYYRYGAAYNDPYLRQNQGSWYQWFHEAVGSNAAWNAGYTGQGIKVAVLDTGVSAHDDVTLKDSYNILTDSTDGAEDDNAKGHGTHVAGIIGATCGNRAGGCGVAPEAALYNIKILDKEARGTSADLIRGVKKAVSLQADIINLSVEGMSYSLTEAKVMTQAVEQGTAVFAAAGNDGSQTRSYPGAYADVICVGATDRDGSKAYLSNYGSWVDLAAPGMDITAPAAISTNTYRTYSGTSQATAVTSGIAAVILSAQPAALKDKTGNLLTGRARVLALEKLMKNGAVKTTGTALGSGIPGLTKILKLSSAAETPGVPVFTLDGRATRGGLVEALTADVMIQVPEDQSVYYTLDGSTPAYKNGVVYGRSYVRDSAIHINYQKTGSLKEKIVLKAIAVNPVGKVSKVATATFILQPPATSISNAGPYMVIAGKKAKLKVVQQPTKTPYNRLTWSVWPENGTEGENMKPYGVSITSKGVFTTTPRAVPGRYKVKAVAKDPMIRGVTTTVITVLASPRVGAVSFTTKSAGKIYKNKESSNEVVSLEIQPFLKIYTADGVLLEPASCSEYVSFRSSNTEVAEVTTKGIVYGKKPGTVTITAQARDGSGKKASIQVTVEQLPELLAWKHGTVNVINLARGKSVTLGVSFTPEKKITKANQKLVWTIDGVEGGNAASGVTVKNGKVTASSDAVAGIYTVTAATLSGKSVEQKIKICDTVIKKLTLDQKKLRLLRDCSNGGVKGNRAELQLTMAGGEDRNSLVLTSSQPKVASVRWKNSSDPADLTLEIVAGKVEGRAVITVTATDGSRKKINCTVDVKNYTSSLSLSPAAGRSNVLAVGKTLKLMPSFETAYGALDQTAKKLEWSSSNENIATVDAKGVVTAKPGAGEGWVTIYAKTTDGSNAQARYYVYITKEIKKMAFCDSENQPVNKLKDTITMAELQTGTKDYFLYLEDQNGKEYLQADQKYWSFRTELGKQELFTARVEMITEKSTGKRRYVLRLTPIRKTIVKKQTVTIKISTMDGSGATASLQLTVKP